MNADKKTRERKAGQDPWSSCRDNISHLVKETDTFIVYLDSENDVEWECTNGHSREIDERALGEIQNRAALLQAVPVDELRSSIKRAFRTLVAEGVARALENDSSSAHAMLDKAEEYVSARTGELFRPWYVAGAAGTALALLVVVVLIHLLAPEPIVGLKWLG